MQGPDLRQRHPWRRLALVVAAMVALGTAVAGCTDANLYSPSRAKAEANRLGVEGRVCTEDPVQSRFPVRVLLLVDRAKGPLFSDFDPNGRRIQVLQQFVRDTLQIPKTAISVVGYAGRPNQLAPRTGNFTDNPGALSGAINQLAIPRSCAAEDQCRNYRDALRTARATIEGDLARLPAGARILTQYFVLMVNAGPHRPLIDPDSDFCTSSTQGGSGGSDRERARACERRRASSIVTDMRELVADSGGGGFKFHGIQLAAHSGNRMNGGAIDDHVQSVMEAMAFAGNGTFQRLDAAGGFRTKVLDVLDFRTELRSKLLMAANHNVVPGPDGPRVDSDADGLSDGRESNVTGTDPTRPDTDGDGITDRVELLVGLDPTSPDDPNACRDLDEGGDRDLDRLTNCDEKLLGTEPTLVDSDGDALPDSFEVFSGTDYLNRDGDQDTDGDGVSNAEEIRRHLDPRSNDRDVHLSDGYRYDIEDRGVVTDLFASQPEQLTGVEVVEISDGTTAGLGTLEYRSSNRQIRWRDARDDRFGRWIEVGDGGRFRLPSGSFAPVQGEQGRRISVRVRPRSLPPEPVTESVRITSRRRQCLTYDIRNIRLAETKETARSRRGSNDIVLYFSQAPAGSLRRPGPYRRAEIPVRFNPPDARDPSAAVLEVKNREFVRPPVPTPADN